MSTIPTPGNTIIARLGVGADQGPQPRISIVQGPNMVITVVNDPAQNEIDITFSSVGGGGTDWLDQFFAAETTNESKGTYPSFVLVDGEDVTYRQLFMIPSDIVTVVRAAVVVIPNAGGDLYWSCATNFGQICANEGYQTNTDSIALNASTLTQDEIECIDISAALTGGAGGDLVGIEFTRDATDALDTINEDVHYLGIIIQGST